MFLHFLSWTDLANIFFSTLKAKISTLSSREIEIEIFVVLCFMLLHVVRSPFCLALSAAWSAFCKWLHISKSYSNLLYKDHRSSRSVQFSVDCVIWCSEDSLSDYFIFYDFQNASPDIFENFVEWHDVTSVCVCVCVCIRPLVVSRIDDQTRE